MRVAESPPAELLPDVAQLREDAERWIAQGRPGSLVLFDLIGFKRYNDAYGYACGDAMLRRLARGLVAAVAGYGRVYRARGDEFGVLVSAEAEAAVIAAASDALRSAGEGFVIGSSHGSAGLGRECGSASVALTLADQRQHERRDRARAALRPPAPPTEERSLLHVGSLALAMARELGLPDEGRETLEAAVQLRDVGLMALPYDLLGAGGALEEQDAAFLRLHPLVGERLLRARFGMDEVAVVVRSSHERWDGAGYPDGLRGEEIPPASRIVFACSALQDMTTGRPHRAALSVAQAVRELREAAGGQFDPAVVGALLRVLRDAPV